MVNDAIVLDAFLELGHDAFSANEAVNSYVSAYYVLTGCGFAILKII